MKIYIAAPLFNQKQVEIIESIEKLCIEHRHDYYSPRLHSGSHLLSPEDKKDFNKWKLVFESNMQGLLECNIMIAVLEYAFPMHGNHYTTLAVVERPVNKSEHFEVDSIKEIEIPDAGVVFEMGAFKMMNKPIVGFHTYKQLSQMNLMLTHSVNGLITGLTDLIDFFSEEEFDWRVCKNFSKEVE